LKQIIHIDVAAFAVAVERVREPRLAGRPVLIAPQAPRALVLALSDEARSAGVRRGMLAEGAVRLCRDAVVLAPDEPLYTRAATAVREILSRFTPLVEPVGYARTFLDVTGTGRLFGSATDVAARLQREIRGRLRLPASAGVAVNKLVSRVAADESLPTGLIEVHPGDEAPFLAPLPVRRLPGIGRGVSRELEDLNIRIVRQLAAVSVGHLTLAFGRMGIVLHERALGIDPTPVLPPERDSAIVEEARLAEDTVETARLVLALREMVERGAWRLRRRGERSGRLDLAVRYADDRTAAGRLRLAEASALDGTLLREAAALLERVRRRRVRVRGMTLRFAAIERGPRQMRLFDEEPMRREEALAAAIDRLRARGCWGSRETSRARRTGRGRHTADGCPGR
jgi:DNA polymerase-4